MNGVNHTEEQLLKKISEVIDANLHNEQFGVNEIAAHLRMSRTTLHRKVKTIFNISVTELIRETRLKRARELLLQKAGTISEIAYNVGFGSVSYFTKCFHDYYGYPPGEAEKRVDTENRNIEKKPTTNQSKPGRKKILAGSLILVVLLTALVLFHLKPFKAQTLPKTIAVLPFINDSKDDETTTILNGLLEGIIQDLSDIEDLTCIKSRTSVEQYRNNNTKSIKQIGKELNVAYLVEGSGQLVDDHIKIHVQLIEAKADKHLRSKNYERKIDDVFDLQNEIAFLVAEEIGAIITPEEKEKIEVKPTKSILAYKELQKARNITYTDNPEYNNLGMLEKEKFIRKAIILDSAYSDAYVDLGWHLYSQGKTNDTILQLANRALNFDHKNSNAFYLKGCYLLFISYNPDEAEEAFRKTTWANTHHSFAYENLGNIMFYKADYAQMVKYKLKAITLERGPARVNYLPYFCFQLYSLGFFNEGLKFSEELIENEVDSTIYYLGLEAENMNSGNYIAAYENCLKSRRPENLADWWCRANVLCYLNDFKETLNIVDALDKKGGPDIMFFKKNGQIIPNHYVGFTYLKNGLKEKAAFHFNGVINEQQKIIRENKGKARGYAYYTLICTYSAMGDKVKAVETMKKMLEHKDEIPVSPVTMLEFRNHPMCEIIKDTPEHHEILKIAEERFQPVKSEIEGYLRDAGY
jgi:TolB-like protein/AraC-like DNA-binding protein